MGALPRTMLLATVLGTAAVAMSGCGGGETRVEPRVFARSFCATLGQWIDHVDAAEARLDKAMEHAPNPAEGRRVWTVYMDEVVRTTKTVRVGFASAGVPRVPNGEKLADQLGRFPIQLAALYRRSRARVETLPTNSWTSFNGEVSAISSEITAGEEKAAQDLAGSLTALNAERLDTSFGEEAACSGIGDKLTHLEDARRERAQTVLADDFSSADCDDEWATKSASSPQAKLDCVRDEFSILVRDPAYYQHAFVRFPAPQDDVTIEVIAETGSPIGLYYGVACWASKYAGYFMYLKSTDRWVILKRAAPGKSPKTVAKGKFAAGQAWKSILGECEARPDGSNVLTFAGEGTQLTHMAVGHGFKEFRSVSFGVETDRPNGRANFDNLVVRAL